ncbi:MAG TPA: glutamate--cysteine ligase [Rubrobacteraceae bacterium]|nr:glutamate--cysteine ligase [Rubrobacteraceae bacterium]
MKANFGASAPYTVGIEEEFQLVDPATWELTPVIDQVLSTRTDRELTADSLASELSASCLELRSPVCGTVAELARELPILRRKVRNLVEGCEMRLAAAGTHPFSDATAQPITAAERYRRVEEEMGWTARMQAIYGLHVHVAVPDEEHAIRAVNALSRHVPLFIALSANSPFWRGSDTRLSSTRVKVFSLVPRSGLPPSFHFWEDYEDYVEALVRAGSIPDYTWCWWDVRPHPGLGTVELRAPDAQTDAACTASLAALAQCLVATADEHRPEDPLLTEENKWRTTRHGLDARLHEFLSGHSATARDSARAVVKALRPASQDLGCEAELEGLLEIVEGGTGAEKQRAVFGKRSSPEDVARYLVAKTA